MNNRFIVLETKLYHNTLEDIIQYMLSSYSINSIEINKKKIRRILHAIVKNIIDTKKCYETPTDLSEELHEILFTTKQGDSLTIVKKLLKDLSFSNIIDSLEKQIQSHIGAKTFSLWEIVSVGDLIALVEGEDFRIKEYHRLTNSVNDEAVILLNCTNIITYLTNKFIQYYGLPVHIHPEIICTKQITLMFLETLCDKYPCIKYTDKERSFLNPDYFLTLGITNGIEFINETVSEIITGFGLTCLNDRLDKYKHYELEYSSSGILAIYEQEPKGESELNELLTSLLNGDYLPPHEREIAERLYQQAGFTN